MAGSDHGQVLFAGLYGFERRARSRVLAAAGLVQVVQRLGTKKSRQNPSLSLYFNKVLKNILSDTIGLPLCNTCHKSLLDYRIRCV